MSTQLLENRSPADEVTGEIAAAPPRLDGLSFDKATRHRLVVAEAVADTLETLSDSRAWDRLDPAIQQHLLAQARRLEEHVTSLGSQRVVRSVEDAALRLKRLERRLEIAVDHLAPPESKGKAPGGLFLGDFTEAELSGEEPAEGRKKKAGRKESVRAKAGAALNAGVARFKTKAEKAAAKASARRMTAYVLFGAVLTAAAVAWNLKETFAESRMVSRPPTAGFKMNQHLGDIRVFVPATTTVLKDRDMRVAVSKEWLLRSEEQRRQDAEGAHVWLSNRNINGLMLAWEDGTPLAMFKDGKATWFSMAVPGQVLTGPPTSD